MTDQVQKVQFEEKPVDFGLALSSEALVKAFDTLLTEYRDGQYRYLTPWSRLFLDSADLDYDSSKPKEARNALTKLAREFGMFSNQVPKLISIDDYLKIVFEGTVRQICGAPIGKKSNLFIEKVLQISFDWAESIDKTGSTEKEIEKISKMIKMFLETSLIVDADSEEIKEFKSQRTSMYLDKALAELERFDVSRAELALSLFDLNRIREPFAIRCFRGIVDVLSKGPNFKLKSLKNLAVRLSYKEPGVNESDIELVLKKSEEAGLNFKNATL